MNHRILSLLIASAAVLALPGCGFVNKTLGTVTNAAGGLLNTVTGPVRGLTNAAEPTGTEAEWRARLDQLKRERDAAHDRRRSETKRHR